MRIRLAVAGIALLIGGTAHADPFPSAWLPRRGDGYLIPPTWAERGLRYGTPDLVGLIERAARSVAEEEPGATLYVADLSLKNGAWTQWHRSHRSGCDADLIFFAVDEDGQPVAPPEQMVRYNSAGIAVATRADGEQVLQYFDVPRNWALVRALVTDDGAQIRYLFIASSLRAHLLAYAERIGEPASVINRAAAALAQPSDSQRHDDHLHVRVVPPFDTERLMTQTYARAEKPGHRHRPQKFGRATKKVKKAKHKPARQARN